jgi:flagellar protein FlgJ
MNRRTAVVVGVVVATAVLLLTIGRTTVTKITTFVSAFVNGAKAAAAQYNLPVWLFLTAGAHESAMGLSQLARNGYNFFGFTADDPKSAWRTSGKPTIQLPTTEYKNGIPYKTVRYFRKYASPAESFADYGRLLTANARYAPAVAAARAGSPAETFLALGKSGYATDPTYGTKLASVYQSMLTAIKAVS